jgi:hypothetical protein
MPTNPPTYTALRKMATLIDKELKAQTSQDVVDEIKALNKLLKKHLAEQKKQLNQYDGHYYTVDKKKQKIQRRRDGKVETKY